jgi:hypothetical protein
MATRIPDLVQTLNIGFFIFFVCCFFVVFVVVFVLIWQLLSAQFIRVKYVTINQEANIVQIVNNTFAAIVSCLI